MSDGWLRAIPMWDWHAVQLAGYPGWDRDPGAGEPLRVDLTIRHGIDRSSHSIASEFDDEATAAFYYRDFTDNNIPFVRDGDVYRSAFWFSRRADHEAFRKTYLQEVAI